MTHLTSLTAKIIAAVPEIVELKEGCRFIKKGLDYATILGVRVGYYDCWVHVSDCEDEWYEYQKIKKNEIKEIIGRPITILDIIQTLNKNDLYVAQVDDDTWEIFESRVEGNMALGSIGLNLQNPLPLQLPETWKFLDELIPEPS